MTQGETKQIFNVTNMIRQKNDYSSIFSLFVGEFDDNDTSKARLANGQMSIMSILVTQVWDKPETTWFDVEYHIMNGAIATIDSDTFKFQGNRLLYNLLRLMGLVALGDEKNPLDSAARLVVNGPSDRRCTRAKFHFDLFDAEEGITPTNAEFSFDNGEMREYSFPVTWEPT